MENCSTCCMDASSIPIFSQNSRIVIYLSLSFPYLFFWLPPLHPNATINLNLQFLCERGVSSMEHAIHNISPIYNSDSQNIKSLRGVFPSVQIPASTVLLSSSTESLLEAVGSAFSWGCSGYDCRQESISFQEPYCSMGCHRLLRDWRFQWQQYP